MAKGNSKTDRSSKGRKVGEDAPKSKDRSTVQLSRAFQVLREGLRTIDDAADLLRAALMDMDTGMRPSSQTGHHLNGVGKFIQLKKMKDQFSAAMNKPKNDASLLPGGNRKFA